MKKSILVGTCIFSCFLMVMVPNISAVDHILVEETIQEKIDTFSASNNIIIHLLSRILKNFLIHYIMVILSYSITLWYIMGSSLTSIYSLGNFLVFTYSFFHAPCATILGALTVLILFLNEVGIDRITLPLMILFYLMGLFGWIGKITEIIDNIKDLIEDDNNTNIAKKFLLNRPFLNV